MKYLTEQKIEELDACSKSVHWVKQNITGDKKRVELIPLLQEMIKCGRLDDANWLIPRCMRYEQCVRYAVFAAKQVLPIFEKEYPDDKRPRKAINAATVCMKNPSKKNRAAARAAYAAARAAYAAAATAAYAAADVAYAAARAAYAATAAYATADAACAAARAATAAYAACVAARAAYATAAYATAAYATAAYATAAAARAAYAVDDAARKEMRIKILKYGIKLLK